MQYTYKGNTYSYEPWDDIEPEENSKRFHDVYLIDSNFIDNDKGRTCLPEMPMSPYETVTLDVFKMWIQSGMPTKKDMGLKGNARNKDIEEYYWKMIDNKIDRMLILGETDEVSE